MRVVSLVSSSLLIASAALAQPAPDPGAPYLAAALQASAYLSSVELPQATGVAWPASDAPGTYVSTGVDSGAAGIGLFYLRLYRVTGDSAYLNKAHQAADYVDSQYRANGNYGDYDWLSGVAGGGEFFLALYAETGDSTFLDRASFAGDWLVNNAIADASGYHWEFPGVTSVYTSLAHGAGGVALFLARLYQATGNTKYLQYAEGAARWLRQFTVPLGNSGIGWKRLTTDTVTYNGWCGGSAGVYFILKKLWQVTGNADYLNLMLATARGLVAVADWSCPGGGVYSASTGCPVGALPLAAWGYSTPSYGDYPEIVCHGVASMLFALFDAYQRTGDVTFLEAARAGIRWLEAAAQVQPQGLRWEHIYGTGLLESGLLTGTASIGHAFLRFARLDPAERQALSAAAPASEAPLRPQLSSRYLQEAEAAAQYLLGLADHPQPGQSRWITYVDKPAWAADPVGFPVEYDTGWYTGAAGIGIFFLDLHDAVCGIEPDSDELSPLNP